MIGRTITEVINEHTPKLMAVSGVVGTALGLENGTPCIVVFVRKKDARLERELPRQIEGFPVRVDEVGDIGPMR